MSAACAQQLHIASPDGSHAVTFYLEELPSGARELRYTVGYKGSEVIAPSRAGLEMDNEAWEKALGFRTLQQPESWMHPMVVDSVSRVEEVDTQWHNAYG